jgi:hypothetical protein
LIGEGLAQKKEQESEYAIGDSPISFIQNEYFQFLDIYGVPTSFEQEFFDPPWRTHNYIRARREESFDVL